MIYFPLTHNKLNKNEKNGYEKYKSYPIFFISLRFNVRSLIYFQLYIRTRSWTSSRPKRY